MPQACLRCGSLKTADNVELRVRLHNDQIARQQSMCLAVDLDPDASKFFVGMGKEYESAALRALLCADCGHIELVAEDPLRLYTVATAIQRAFEKQAAPSTET